ncbi:MAG: UvrD-helicase domain-containing protein [Candidatus Hinthialibacter antarcticus]|nr:UvrD-helicase domain-containing protein [Candidatus Hinthialibacter antarcticus]
MKSRPSLNDQQRAAVTHTGGPLLVLAGAGSGKTGVITHRIAHLIAEGASPSSILALTFTNKAAKEMRERVKKLIGAKAKQVTLSTFHSLGLKTLRLNARAAGLRRDFVIYNEGDQMSLVRTLIREHPQRREKFDPGIVLSRISRVKNRSAGGAETSKQYGDKYDLIFDDIYDRYHRSMRSCQAVDFDDLILLPIQLLEKNEDVRQTYRETFKHLLVDEYQDTNAGQYRLLRLLAGDGKALCVVGDDDQSIYGWRGAEVGNILRFEKDFPKARVIKLEQNYRSTQVILDAAHHVIQNNSKRQSKKLWTNRGQGRFIDAFMAKDEADEAKTIAFRIQAIQERTDAPWKAFAVLYRSNVQSRAIESNLRLAGIPYNVAGGYEYFERKEVKDLIAYLRVVANPDDDLNLLRIINYPRRGIGDHTIALLTEHATHSKKTIFHTIKHYTYEDLPKAASEGLRSFGTMIEGLREIAKRNKPAELVRALIERSRYREALMEAYEDAQTAQMKIELAEELASAASTYQEQTDRSTLIGFLDSVALDDDAYSKNDKKQFSDNAVLLATLHSAKGLEFPYVFLCGLEENLLPHSRSVKDNTEVDEERRLCYVGMTRAKSHLTLSFADERSQYGRRAKRTPSRFLKEIPNQYLCKQFSHSELFFDLQRQSNGKE